MVSKRIVLTFPHKLADKPIVYKLVKDFDLVTNILRAEIEPPEIGRMLVELSGEKDAIDAGVKWLAEAGVDVEDAARDIIKLGGYDYLMKPCPVEELVLKIDAAFERKLQREKNNSRSAAGGSTQE